MKIRLSDLWRWDGTIDRGAYAVWAIVLALVKHNFDRVVTWIVAGDPLLPLHYWIPGEYFGRFPSEGLRERALLWVLVTMLPFLWPGVMLTLRRLRAAGLPGALVLFFFVPVVNLILFLTLCILPTRRREADAQEPRDTTFLDRLMPHGAAASAGVSLLIVVPVTVSMTYLSAATMGNYGWGLFVGVPFFLGLTAVLLHGYRVQRRLGECLLVATTAVFFLSLILLGFAIEGVVCLAMAAPIGFPLAALGGFVGYLIQNRPRGGAQSPQIFSSLTALLTLVIGLEHARPTEPPLFEVKTQVEVHAPAEIVWHHVVAFADLPPPTDWLFRIGVAYPLRAEIEGSGPGAIRHCVFSTGAFVEPIEVWDEPRRLAFSVSEQPPAMRELMLYPGAEPPHVSDYLVSQRGEFLLEPLVGGRTRLTGTTWYTHKMWPAAYWRVWSDWILHRIHRRVLEHIQRRSEHAAR